MTIIASKSILKSKPASETVSEKMSKIMSEIKSEKVFEKVSKIMSEIMLEPVPEQVLKKVSKPKSKRRKAFVDTINECRVCREEFATDEEKEMLKCGHVFHYECIILSFDPITKLGRVCPYCRKSHGFLRLKEGVTPIGGIHREYEPPNAAAITKKVPPKVIKICKGIYKSGAKKGLHCTAKANYNNYNFCGRHKEVSDVINDLPILPK
jgi:hypothetical protein